MRLSPSLIRNTIGLLTAGLVLAVIWTGLNQAEMRFKAQTINSLETVLNSTHTSISKIWLKGLFRDLNRISSNPFLAPHVKALLKHKTKPQQLLEHPAQQKLRSFFRKFLLSHDALGIFVITADGTSLVSMRDSNTGTKNLIKQYYPDHLKKAFNGQNQLIPPIPSDTPLLDSNGNMSPDTPTMFILAPLRDEQGHVIAVISMRLDPFLTLAAIAFNGQLGETGESYLFNKSGYMLSESRFKKQLKQVGLLGGGDDSTLLKQRLIDPGYNLATANITATNRKDQPLTWMVQQAIAGISGSSPVAHRDYRGIAVFSAWLWDEDLGIGLATEIDEQEAMEHYQHMRLIVIGMLMAIGLLSLLFYLINRHNRRKHKAKLRKSETHLRAILDNTVDGIITINEQGLIQSFNLAAHNLFGYTESEVLNKNINILMPRTHQEHHDRYLEKYRQHGHASTIGITRSIEGQHKDDSIFPIRIGLSEALINDEKVFTGIVQDITKEKEAEEKLNRYNNELEKLVADRSGELQQFKNTLDQTLDSVLMFSADDLQFFYINEGAQLHLGYSEDELKQLHPFDIIPDFTELQFRNLVKPLLTQKQESLSIETTHQHKSGKIFPVYIVLQYINNKNGNSRFVAVAHDISEQKKMEAKLIQSKSDAEAANRAKSQFLATMSHEIRTPINAVIGMIGTAIKGQLDDGQRHRLSIAHSSAKSLLSIINNVLDFSKIEADKLQLENITFDLRLLFEDTVRSFSFSTEEKNLELILDISAIHTPHVKGDPTRLQQIITNLISNAIKFTEHGGVNITASLNEHNNNSHILHFEVNDTGIGIQPDRIGHLFDSFTQEDASTTRQYGGSGLGLAICKKICNFMQGSIQVISEPGQGTVFSCSIPLNKSKQTFEKIDLQQQKILIFNSNALASKALHKQLEAWEAAVYEAATLETALSLCDKQSFDIALFDIHDAESQGITLAKKIRETSHEKKTKLILMALNSHPINTALLTEVDFFAYCHKPILASELYRVLNPLTDNASPIDLADLDDLGDGYSELTEKEEIHTQDQAPTWTQTHAPVQFEAPSWPKDTQVLLAEDNMINRMVAEDILEGIGLSCNSVENGQEAIQTLLDSPDSNPYTLILMDCQMPILDGYQATEQIRQGKAGDRYINIPIIAVTANAMKGDKDDCLACGMDDYISKPIDDELLARTLQKYLLKK